VSSTSRRERIRMNTGETTRNAEELSPQQEGAIVALLSDPGLTGAAKAAGVGKATLWRWMQQPAFRDAYRRARREAVEQARARLQQASGEAVEVLRGVMNDEDAPHASRISAAKTVLVMAMQATSEEEIERRLTALEEARPIRKGA
jgi:DNA-binding MurR/RpiR family transcriptional regulator